MHPSPAHESGPSVVRAVPENWPVPIRHRSWILMAMLTVSVVFAAVVVYALCQPTSVAIAATGGEPEGN